MDGLLVVGHGSLRPYSAVGMQRVAKRLEERVPYLAVEAGFLNYGKPTIADCAAALAVKNVEKVSVQPYFLTTGQYVSQDLHREIRRLRVFYPELLWQLHPVLGDHPYVSGLLNSKIEHWTRGLAATRNTGVVLVAHGSHYAKSVRQVQSAVARLKAVCGETIIIASFLEINRPDLVAGCRELFRKGVEDLAVLPYFLHLGRHVREDLPRILATLAGENPDRAITLLDPLEDSQGISEIILSHMSPVSAPVTPL